MDNIAHHVPRMAHRQPQTLAIVQPIGMLHQGRLPYRHFTFQELHRETDRLALGLEKIGLRRGMRTVLMVPPSLEFYALTFALFKLGAVIVLIDPGMGVKNLGVCLKEADPVAFIGVPKAHLGRVLLGWARSSIKLCVTVGYRMGWEGVTLEQVRRGARMKEPYRMAETAAADQAAILFTSGSTGVAKGVVATHSIFANQLEMLRGLYHIEPGEIDLPTFPLFGLFAPALGITAVIPQMDPTRPAHVNPQRIIAAIHHFGVTNLFGSPALIQRVGRYGEAHGVKLPTLRRVISAGAPVPASAIARFCSLLNDGVQVHTPYGATEALPVSSIGSAEILGETAQRTAQGGGVCVGRPVPGMLAKIIRTTDEPIAQWQDELEVSPGEIGEITVAGTGVTTSYFNRPQSTVLAKIADGHGGVYHRMGDLGYFDPQGRLWFCGRKAHRVITPEAIYYTIPCEGVFNAHAAVYRTALVGVPRAGVMKPVLCVEREKGTSLSGAQLRAELLQLGAAHPHTRAIQTILFHPSFPVDIRHNAKIFREKLATWAATKLSAGAP